MSALINLSGEAIAILEEVEPPAITAQATLTLDALPCGVTARVLTVGGSGPIARRLMEMGVLPGAPIRVVRCAPLGDPIQVCVRHYHLALRRVEARTITVIASEV